MLLDSDCEKGKRQGEAARGSERTILNESERKDYGEKREREHFTVTAQKAMHSAWNVR